MFCLHRQLFRSLFFSGKCIGAQQVHRNDEDVDIQNEIRSKIVGGSESGECKYIAVTVLVWLRNFAIAMYYASGWWDGRHEEVS